MNLNIFDGVVTAIITPLRKGKLDIPALKALIDRQIESGINGILVSGSTGEGSSLSKEENFELIEIATKHANKRANIIAGITAISTVEALDKVKKLSTLDIDGIMCTAPQYIKPEQEGLFEHFKKIHDATTLPLMLYIHPGRTGCDFTDETLIRIMKLERFTATKDASSDLERPLRILPKVDINMLTGNDSAFLSYSANGGTGNVSVIANIFPRICKQIDNSWKDGEFGKALVLQRELTPFFTAIFTDSNPIGIKYAAFKLGLCSEEILLPLTFAREVSQKAIDKELERLMSLEENV
jgi:4-hydroxy-tetrahydrodipicolinate synthase